MGRNLTPAGTYPSHQRWFLPVSAGTYPSGQRCCAASASHSGRTKGGRCFAATAARSAETKGTAQLPYGSGETQGKGGSLHFVDPTHQMVIDRPLVALVVKKSHFLA
jgi:hypothetical protein